MVQQRHAYGDARVRHKIGKSKEKGGSVDPLEESNHPTSTLPRPTT